MSISVHVYLLNLSSYERHDMVYDDEGNPEKTEAVFVDGPNLVELDAMEEIVSRFFPDDLIPDLVIHFVDPYYKLNHYSTTDGKLYYNKLHKIKNGENSRFYQFHDVSWNCIQEDVVINPDDVYFFMSGDNFINDYDFFNFLNIKVSNNVFVNYNVKSFRDISETRTPYNIFGIEHIQNSFDILGNEVFYDEEAIEWMTENGVSHCKLLKEACVHKKERFIQSKLPSWCLNVESHYMKGIILEYEIFPDRKIIFSERLCIGKTIQEKFLESANYRETILNYMIRKLILIEGVYKDRVTNIFDPYEFNLDLFLM